MVHHGVRPKDVVVGVVVDVVMSVDVCAESAVGGTGSSEEPQW